ncbi:alpha/beta hydrolase [Rhodopseudomonas sp. P2A-2r]|uniref:alpha/beta hydrolase family protein n=1 Tax=Rhodopseudomonas sp. P2A-2r TaxID=2991972 RepID=UPI002234D683|nr:alpha/beta fold hydrolase [Rhodopseudomonas sp. P2A-2r]UZE50992.1 alpha/beta hydrolase [Rhodopseudomonas sp. P2A-2r]
MGRQALLIKFSALAIVLFCLSSSARAAGIQLLNADPSMSGAIWYPCAGKPEKIALGNLSMAEDFGLMGVKDCPVTRAKLPLIIISHGRGGWFGAHHDTAEALADAGFVVAAINHPGDNGSDPSQTDKMSLWASRPTDMVHLLDFLLRDWKDKAVINADRVGLFGFSLGGYTGLVLSGAHADFLRLALFCKETEKGENCERARRGDVPASPQSDPRIKVAVLADTAMSFAFTPEGLSGVHIPIQIWRSELGGNGVSAKGTALTASQLPGQPDIRIVPAGHFAFLAPCQPKLATAIPRICTDMPPGFDRAAFHRDFNASVERFFHQRLIADGETR